MLLRIRQISIQKKIVLCGLVLFLLGLCAVFLMPRERMRNTNAALRIGAGDDISGYLLERVLEQDPSLIADSSADIEAYTFQDCWTNTAQWALRSDEIDLAFYCSHMAAHLVDQDDRLMIYGPVIMNAEVLAAKKESEKITRLGIGQQRKHLQGLIREAHPEIGEIVEMSPRILPYSLSDGQIDGAVLDVTKASLLSGFQFAPIAKHDYISYVLVIRKDLIGSAPFERFLEAYRNAVDGLQEVYFDPALPKEYTRFLYLD